MGRPLLRAVDVKYEWGRVAVAREDGHAVHLSCVLSRLSKDAPDARRGAQALKRLTGPRPDANASQSIGSLKEDDDSQARQGSDSGSLGSVSPQVDAGNRLRPRRRCLALPATFTKSGSFSSRRRPQLARVRPPPAGRPPEITGVARKQGPEEGGTRVTVRGVDLGERKTDIWPDCVQVDCLRSLEYVSSRRLPYHAA